MLKQKKTHRSSIFNSKGMSIVEVLVAAGLASIVALGIATMVQNMMIEQKKVVLFATLKELKTRIESQIKDPSIWTAILSNASNLAITPTGLSTTCLVATTPTLCTEHDPTTPSKLIIPINATVQYNLLDWAGAGSGGFSESGGECTTFSATNGAGIDNCPISYKLTYRYDCPTGGTGTTCYNPQIYIVGRLIFNPSTTGVLNRFKTLIGVGDMASAAGAVGKYDIFVQRTASQVNRTFQLAMRLGSGGSTGATPLIQQCNVAGGGVCNAGAWGNYPGGRTWTTIDNAYSIATGISGQNFQVSANGTYSCSIRALNFSTGSFSVRLYNATSNAAVQGTDATTNSGQWATSTALSEARVFLTAGQNYTVQNTCEHVSPVEPVTSYVTQDCSLGFRQNPYAGNTDIVVLSCFIVDDR